MAKRAAQRPEYSLRETGFSKCLPKPIRARDLVEALIAIASSDTPSEVGADSARTKRAIAETKTLDLGILRPRILLADDNAVNVKVTARMLETLGCEVDVAEDGRRALESVMDRTYDLVLMDCQMPEMDGFEATREIRRLDQKRRLPIIALTANAMQGVAEQCRASGMDGYMTKPVRKQELGDVLKRWLPVASQAVAR
jgi:CheY-like chemotaxis protein